jgi:uncharacterized protein DUF4282
MTGPVTLAKYVLTDPASSRVKRRIAPCRQESLLHRWREEMTDYPQGPGQWAERPADQPGQGAGQPGAGGYGQPGAVGYGQPGAGGYGQPPAGGHGQPPAGGYGQPAGRPTPRPQVSGSSTSFLSALFDFSFSSFVTPKVIKVLYILIMILAGLTAAGFIISAFALSVEAGLITLIIIAPLFFFITIALYRILLEFFMVIFRMAEDIKAMRDRGGLG